MRLFGMLCLVILLFSAYYFYFNFYKKSIVSSIIPSQVIDNKTSSDKVKEAKRIRVNTIIPKVESVGITLDNDYKGSDYYLKCKNNKGDTITIIAPKCPKEYTAITH